MNDKFRVPKLNFDIIFREEKELKDKVRSLDYLRSNPGLAKYVLTQYEREVDDFGKQREVEREQASWHRGYYRTLEKKIKFIKDFLEKKDGN